MSIEGMRPENSNRAKKCPQETVSAETEFYTFLIMNEYKEFAVKSEGPEKSGPHEFPQ